MCSDFDCEMNYNVPPVQSRRWKSATLPLLAFIEKGDRSTAEIITWGRGQKHTDMLTRHMLAWLSYSDLVYYVAPSAVWHVGAEPAGLAETWDSSEGRLSKSRRLLDPIPQNFEDPNEDQVRPLVDRE